jgi:hypothetical protein
MSAGEQCRSASNHFKLFSSQLVRFRLTHGRSDRSLGVRSKVGRDHDETESETDRLTVDQPETDESGPGVGLFVGQEGLGEENGTEC